MYRDDTSEILTVLARRYPMLAALIDGPVEKRILEDRFDVSRSTVNRAIRELETLKLVVPDGGGYRTTATGRLLTERFESFEKDVSVTIDVADLLAELPPDAQFDPVILVDGTVERATAPNPNRLLAEMAATLESTDRLWVLGKALSYEPTIDSFHTLIGTGSAVHAVFDPALVSYLESNHEPVIDAAIERDTIELRSIDALPYSLLIGETNGETHGYLVIYESAGNFIGLIHNDTEPAVTWFRDVFESYWETAEPV